MATYVFSWRLKALTGCFFY